ncbi:MAG: hypothetical protein VXZ05_03055 [Pseudomonadota bacterium]|nr:hypothetical protein [Pseudomonadota bacterium]
MLMRLGWLLTLYALALVARADIVVATSGASTAADQLSQAFSQSSQISSPIKRWRFSADDNEGGKEDGNEGSGASQVGPTDIVVLAGCDAWSEFQRRQLPNRALVLWCPRAQLEGISPELLSERHVDVLFPEPPLKRQFALTRLLFPDEAVTIMLSSQASEALRKETMALSEEVGVTVFEQTQDMPLNYALRQGLSGAGVLLGVADPALYNATNIKTILISAYRQNIPLIGPHRAYIRAGAIATTYYSLSDLEAIVADWSKGTRVRGVANHFSVQINEQVARSLNLSLPSDLNALAQQLKR